VVGETLVEAAQQCDVHRARDASELAITGELPIDATDVRVAIMRFTDEMPAPSETDRVTQRLIAAGWSVNDDFGVSD
jgi:hypothetical protein